MSDPRKRARWRRTLKRRSIRVLLRLMGREETIERVAAAIALGVGVGFSPFIGFHLILAVALATLFRLNRLDAVLGAFAGNPWTLPPVYAAGYRLGRILLGYQASRFPPIRWHRILHHDFWVDFRGPNFGPRLACFLVGTTIVALLLALACYTISLGVLRLYHRRYPGVAERAARRRTESGVQPRLDDRIGPDERVH
jgi:uncharacterized protein (DUF2062 family)